MTYDEITETIFQNYQRSLDFDIAVKLLGLSEKQKMKVLKDENLQYRITLYDANVQEKIISDLKTFADSANESVGIKATIKLGEIFYKKRFIVDKNKEDEVIPITPDRIILTGSNE